MRLLGRGLLLGLLGLLAIASPAQAETSAELNERLRKATAVLSELASGKQDTDMPREVLAKSETTLGGDVSLTAGPKSLHDAANTDGPFKAEIRYAVPAAGRPFVNVLTSYSPPPKKR